MRALVTGATGFLGSRLVSHLVGDGHEVRALAREESLTDHLPRQAWIIRGDMRNGASLRAAAADCDVVFHAAATTSGSWSEWSEYEQSTVRGTQRMLEAASESGVRRFVHVSSLAVYQVCGHPRNTVVDESDPMEPAPDEVGPYCRAKVESEELAWSFHQRGLPVTILRPGLIYGPSRHPMFPHLGKLVGGRLLLVVGSGRNLLPLVYIDNVVDALMLAARRESAVGEAFNIVDGHGLTQREYLNRLRRATGRSFTVIPLPTAAFVAAAGAREALAWFGLASRRGPTRYGVASKFDSLRFNSTKAREQLGWSPRISLDEGLRETFATYRTRIPRTEPAPPAPPASRLTHEQSRV